MKKRSGSLTLFVFAAYLIALAMTVEQIFVYNKFYSFEEKLWQTGTPGFIPGLVYLMATLTIFFALALAITAKNTAKGKEVRPALPPASRPLRAVSLLVGLSMAIFPILQLFLINSGDPLDEILASGSLSYLPIVAVLHIMTLLFAIPGAYMFLNTARGKGRGVAESLPCMIFLIAFTLRVYFDMTQMLNNPRRSFSVVTVLALLLYVVSEVRLITKPERYASYSFFAVLALTLSAASGFSNLFLNLIGVFSDGGEIAYYLLEALFALYIAVRLYEFSRQSAFSKPIRQQEEEKSAPPAIDAVASAEESITPEEAETADAPHPPVTREELERFFEMIYAAVAEKRNLTAQSSEEDRQAVRAETMAILTQLLSEENPEENLSALRRLIKKDGTTPTETSPLPEEPIGDSSSLTNRPASENTPANPDA